MSSKRNIDNNNKKKITKWIDTSIYAEVFKNGNKSISLTAWIILFCLFFVLYISNIYNDILITAKQSVNLWDLLLSGDILDFCESSVMYLNSNYYSAEQGIGYPFLAYLILAIWNLPLWIIKRIVGHSVVEFFAAKIWIKGILLICILISTDLIYRIVSRIQGKNEAVLAGFFYLSSALLLMYVLVVSQIDIIGVCLILSGIYAWMNGKERLFLLFFALAIGIKFFPFLAFLAVLFIREKKVLKIFLNIIVVMMPTALLQAIIGGSGNVSEMIGGFFNVSFQMGAGVFPVFLFMIIGTLIMAYLYRPKDNKSDVFVLSYVLLIIYSSMTLFVDILPYWSIYIAPFVTLVVFMVEKRRKEAVFAETVLCSGLIYLHMIRFNWVYDGRLIREMGVALKLFGLEDRTSKSSWMNPNEWFTLTGINSDYVKVAVYTCVLLAFVFICGFWLKENKGMFTKEWEEKTKKRDYEIGSTSIYTGRFVFNGLLALFPMIFHLIYMAI